MVFVPARRYDSSRTMSSMPGELPIPAMAGILFLVAWGLIDYNPAKRGVPNPMRRSKEKRPFESWQQLEAVAVRLGPVYGPMVVFAAATGLRPSELFALEQRDIDRALGVVYVRRAYANGRLKHTKKIGRAHV